MKIPIIYFSSSGNTKYICELVSQGLKSIGVDSELIEIEKIKKSLTSLTRLPQSIKEKIEKLFELSQRDIAKANELKQELDKWGVYKEYEDRFLDLFKKPKDKGN